jgi:exosortase
MTARYCFLPSAALAAAIVLAYHDAASDLISAWVAIPAYSHGFLLVPVACWLLWKRRNDLKTLPARPAWLGLVLVAASLLLLLAGRVGAEEFAASLSLLGFLAGGTIFVWGWAHLKRVAFPILLLALAIPLPGPILDPLTFELQMTASRFGETILSSVSVPAFRDGNVIYLATTTLQITEACSGMRSLISLMAFTLVYGHFSEASLGGLSALLVATPPVAVLTNGLRVAGTGIAAHAYGNEAAEGFLHGVSGWLVFVMALALITLLHRAGRFVLGHAARLVPSAGTWV